MKMRLLFSLLLLAFSFNSMAGDTLYVKSWRVKASQAIFMPAFDTIKNVKGEKWNFQKLAEFDFYTLENEDVKSWKELDLDSEILAFESAEDSSYNLHYASSYIETDRFTKLSFACKSKMPFRAWIDGKELFSNTDFDLEKAVEKTKKQSLEQGKHQLVVQFISKKGMDKEASFYCVTADNSAEVKVSNKSTHFMNIDNIMNGCAVGRVSMSPDAKYFLISFSEKKAPEGKTTKWTELRETSSNKVIEYFYGSSAYSFDWMPNSHILTFIKSGAGNKELWSFNPDDQIQKCLVKNLGSISSYTWAPDASFFIYTVSEKSKKNTTGVKRFENPNDHWPWYRTRSFLAKYDMNSGLKTRLTTGYISTYLHDIRSDGKALLFTVSPDDYSQQPFSRQQLYALNLENLTTTKIWDKQYGGSVLYAKDSKKLLVTGSPILFGEIGKNVKNGKIPNNFDNQAYLYDLETEKAEALSKGFDPKIQSVQWSKDGKTIWMKVEEGTYNKIYAYSVAQKKYTEIASGVDVVSRLSIAENESEALFVGCSISTPYKAFYIDLGKGKTRLIADPEAKEYKNVEFGKTEDWDFVSKAGQKINGRVYYPPNFDPKKKYPMIVYYYAGTNPTNRSFGGRYPKNLFAAYGYIVYNLQPSGATGFGQDFSAAHVNDWGKITSKEIIEGVTKFCDEHNYVSRNKIGCLGASYGGFMTMYLQTQTDIFAAAVSHAGISSLSSYWGEGYWGYTYSTTASANSYPWNNRDLYINQSPLFQADKIKTPLLLLHGNSDTNVPTGESRQLFTALKVLNRPVELIEIDKQNHFISDYNKRILWQKSIMAWFDKYLKDNNDWWNDLYPERNL